MAPNILESIAATARTALCESMLYFRCPGLATVCIVEVQAVAVTILEEHRQSIPSHTPIWYAKKYRQTFKNLGATEE